MMKVISTLKPENSPPLFVELASCVEDIRASQRLRYQIFAEEQGAILESASEKIDKDYYDDFCHHLLVRDQQTGEIIGSTRILTETSAKLAGSFYSANEFDLEQLLPLKGNVIEIGRTCIHPDYRNGTGISVLWLGLAQFMSTHKIDYMFGCASVSMLDGGGHISNIMNYAHRRGYLSPEIYRVTPHHPIANVVSTGGKPLLPPLLKSYLKLGAWIVGEPNLDEDFNVADLFILLDVNNLNKHYQKHFMRTAMMPHYEPSSGGESYAKSTKVA